MAKTKNVKKMTKAKKSTSISIKNETKELAHRHAASCLADITLADNNGVQLCERAVNSEAVADMVRAAENEVEAILSEGHWSLISHMAEQSLCGHLNGLVLELSTKIMAVATETDNDNLVEDTTAHIDGHAEKNGNEERLTDFISIASKVESGKSAMSTLLQSMLEVESTALVMVWTWFSSRIDSRSRATR
jgi:hypothetical protein